MNPVLYYARRSPNKFGGEKEPFNPWWQVVKAQGGTESVEVDFLRRKSMAGALASKYNVAAIDNPLV